MSLGFLKLYLLIHFTYNFHVLFYVKGGDLQLVLLVYIYVSSVMARWWAEFRDETNCHI